jgi:hypothetical protein
MLDIENIEIKFKGMSEESKQKYERELQEIRESMFIFKYFTISYLEFGKGNKMEIMNSLVDKSCMEAARLSTQILFLVINGLYKNAYDNIRFIVESGIQSLYIDQRHTKSSLSTKIEIWKEIENAREYHAQPLIGKLDLAELNKEKTTLDIAYKKLSQRIHFGHKQVMSTIRDVIEHKGIPSYVDKEEIVEISTALLSCYDIFFLLMITRFPKVKESLEKNELFIDYLKKNNLPILRRIYIQKENVR